MKIPAMETNRKVTASATLSLIHIYRILVLLGQRTDRKQTGHPFNQVLCLFHATGAVLLGCLNHKDVYKRQEFFFRAASTYDCGWTVRAADNADTSPVSYTHLDVYKRQQVLHCPQNTRL